MIIPLADCPQHLDTIVRWVWDEWRGGQNGQSFEQTHAVMKGNPSHPPTLVAIDDSTLQPRGVLGFRRVMLHGRDPLVLFINSLFVPVSKRRQGIASALLTEAVRRVGPGDEWLYVYTNIAAWYEARGFTAIEREASSGNTVLRMAMTNR